MGLGQTQAQRKKRERDMGFRHLVVRALNLVRRTPGGMTPEQLAFELNKSVTYVKYSVIPTLEQISDCVAYNRHENIVKWICDDGSGQVDERLEQARMS